MPTYTNQQSRLLTLSTPLGDNVLLLNRFTGQEAMSRLFSYQLEALTEEEDIKPQDIVGKNITWGIQEVDKEPRFFNGHVSRFMAGGQRVHGRRLYRMEVVPYLWFLTRTANCRIFQHKKTPEILEIIFGDYGLTDYELALRRSYPIWEYCVQYRETAFNFVSRMMEHEGIFYFFKHENGKHVLVVADHVGAYKEIPESPVDYLDAVTGSNVLSAWEHQFEFRTGKWAHTDYNFKTPSTNLLTNTETKLDIPGADQFEVFDYPGEYPVKGDGQADVKIRMEEEEAGFDVVTGSGGYPTFNPGWKFTLASHEIEAEVGKSYVVTSMQHSASDTSEDNSSETAEYHNHFTCTPADVVNRPQRTTPKPTVQGPQTAVVVGPAGEEIYTDEFGRVKVQFFWDREGKKNENSSCWMRIVQDWAGKSWGMISIPRIGQEVMVEFLEGDPDQPIITGRVYNAEQMPPFTLPEKKMVSGWKSNTYPGGGGYNEMSFDDSKGKELINVHAQYDMVTVVEHDDTQTVHNNRTIQVDGTHTETIVKDTTIKITEGNLDHDVVAGTATYHVAKAVTENFDATQDTTVKSNITIISKEGEILIQAAKKITIVTGASSLTMTKEGAITLAGKNVVVTGTADVKSSAPKIESSGTQEVKMGVGAQSVTCDTAQVATSGTAVKATAVGVHEISGAMVKIN